MFLCSFLVFKGNAVVASPLYVIAKKTPLQACHICMLPQKKLLLNYVIILFAKYLKNASSIFAGRICGETFPKIAFASAKDKKYGFLFRRERGGIVVKSTFIAQTHKLHFLVPLPSFLSPPRSRKIEMCNVYCEKPRGRRRRLLFLAAFGFLLFFLHITRVWRHLTSST